MCDQIFLALFSVLFPVFGQNLLSRSKPKQLQVMLGRIMIFSLSATTSSRVNTSLLGILKYGFSVFKNQWQIKSRAQLNRDSITNQSLKPLKKKSDLDLNNKNTIKRWINCYAIVSIVSNATSTLEYDSYNFILP